MALVQALAGRNEPIPVPDSMGACLVSGLVNWDRVRAWRGAWEAAGPGGRETATWAEEFSRFAARKELYQDRLVLLSGGEYSNVPAAAMGLEKDAWLRCSLAIRREHECTHYFTVRLFGALQHNVLEEVLADAMGLVRGAGGYDPAVALRFLGLERHPRFRPGGRLANYRGTPPLSAPAFRVLQEVVVRAVHRLAELLLRTPELISGEQNQARLVATLAPLTLEELAAEPLGDMVGQFVLAER